MLILHTPECLAATCVRLLDPSGSTSATKSRRASLSYFEYLYFEYLEVPARDIFVFVFLPVFGVSEVGESFVIAVVAVVVLRERKKYREE